MKKYSELSRRERINKIMAERKNNLALVLENLSEEQNVSAILRTAEAFGIGNIYIVYPLGSKPRLSKNISSGAIKWLQIAYFTEIKDCYQQLKDQGFSVVATVVDPSAQSLWQTKLTGKTAIVMGNEAKGLSEEAIKLADKKVYLPLSGLTESLNVSVAAALFVYEAVRQEEK